MPEGSARSSVVDVFISHAGEQKISHAYGVRARLQELDKCINVFLDELSLRPCDDPGAEMHTALQQASLAVVILTKDFVRKWWPTHEVEVLLQRSSHVVLLPVICNNNITYEELCNLERFYEGEGQAPLWETTDKPDKGRRKQCAEWMCQLLDKRTAIRQDQAQWGLYQLLHKVADEVIAQLLLQNRLRLCPVPDPVDGPKKEFLVSIDSRKAAVRRILDSHGVALIHGMVGIGKTLLAKVVYQELAEQQSHSWSACLFWRACDHVGLPPVLQQVVDAAHQAGKGDPWLLEQLKPHKVLLVVDGVPDKETKFFGMRCRTDLMKLFAPGSRLIVTSRDSGAIDSLKLPEQTSRAADCKYAVPLLELDDACELFRRRVLASNCCDEVAWALEDNWECCRESITKICKLCGCLPMAIAVVADNIAEVPPEDDVLDHLEAVDQKLSSWLQTGCDIERKAPDEGRLFNAIMTSLNMHGTSPQLKEALVHVALMLKGATLEEARACCQCAALERHALVSCAPIRQQGEAHQTVQAVEGHQDTQEVLVHQAMLEFCLWALQEHPRKILDNRPHPHCMVHGLEGSVVRHRHLLKWPLAVQALHLQDVPLAAVKARADVVLENLRFLSIVFSNASPQCTEEGELAELAAGVYQLCHVLAASDATDAACHQNAASPSPDGHARLRSAPAPGIHYQKWSGSLPTGVEVQAAVQLDDSVDRDQLPPAELRPEDLSRLFTDTSRLAQLVVLRLSGLSNEELVLPVLPNLQCASISHMPFLTKLQHLEHLCGYQDPKQDPQTQRCRAGLAAAMPKLRQLSLTVARCGRLQQLDLRGGSQHSPPSPMGATAAIMAVLSRLEVAGCGSLQGLHTLGGLERLQEVSLTACPELSWCNPRRVGEWDLRDLKRLRLLRIEGCAKVKEVLGLEGLESGPNAGQFRYCRRLGAARV